MKLYGLILLIGHVLFLAWDLLGYWNPLSATTFQMKTDVTIDW